MAMMECVPPKGPDFAPDGRLRGADGDPGGLSPNLPAPVNWLVLRHARRAMEKAMLPFIETLEDLDILDAIGAHGEQGKPCTYKDLRHAGIAPPATLQRRLRRLVSMGVVKQTNTSVDRRYRHLVLAEAAAAAVHQLERDRWEETLRALKAPAQAAGQA